MAPSAPSRGSLRRATRRMVALTLSIVVLSACTAADDELLRASDFDGATGTEQDEVGQGYVPGPTWCDRLDADSLGLPAAKVSRLWFDKEDKYPNVGAMLARRGLDVTSRAMEDAAAACAEPDDDLVGRSIEPLSGLDNGAIGWRTVDHEGVWGEYAAVPIDSRHLLLVGFETDEAAPPVELDELIRLAREGAERAGLDD